MGLFSNIVDKIFHASGASSEAATSSAASGTPSGTGPLTPSGAGVLLSSKNVDVSAVLGNLASSAKEKLNWRESIVDLLKLLGLDSSLSARKDLAKELHYDGDGNDSAAMNVWLQKQVMRKLAENGGKVPNELLA